MISLDKRLEALEEYAKANRKSILGLDVGANYQQPKNIVPIDDNDSNSSRMVDNDKTNQEDVRSRSTTLEATPNTGANQRRWFWPFS